MEVKRGERVALFGKSGSGKSTLLNLIALSNVDCSGCRAIQTQRRKSAREILEAVGLGHRATHRPAELSGGEQQRVALARALVNEPELLLADEPTGNLDSVSAGEIIELLRHISIDRQMTVILVTHDEDLAQGFSDRIIRMKDGRFVVDSSDLDKQ